MKERLLKNITTSIIGILILAFAAYMFASGKATNAEAITWAGYGLIFLRSKDSLIGLKPKE